MHEQHEKVIAKVAKLLRLAEGKGTTPSEASNAAAAAQALMERHKITLALVDLVGDEVRLDAQPLFCGSKIVHWRAGLAIGLAHLHQCQLLVRSATRGIPNSGYTLLVGRESNMQVARYLYEYLTREIDRLAKDALKERWRPVPFSRVARADSRVWGANFRRGAAYTVLQRLRQARDEARRSAQEDLARRHGAENASRALVLVTEHDKEVERFVQDRWRRNVKIGGGVTNDPDGLAAGRRAGMQIPLRDALQPGVESPQLTEEET